MIRKLFMVLAALAAASCAAPTPATETPSTATVIGIDGRPLVLADGVIDTRVDNFLIGHTCSSERDSATNPEPTPYRGAALHPAI
jgi:hypothetical protein